MSGFRTRLSAALGLAALSATVLAQAPATPPPSPLPYGPAITLETARHCAAAARDAAAKNQWLMVVTVVDPGGHEVLVERMDDAQFGSVEPARQKAYTAVAFRRSTKVFEDMVAAGGPALRILRLPDALPIEGGLPIVKDGRIVGAVGTSGGSAQQDGVVAQACIDALGE
ncbi:MAG TPA: heme-binding protein [Gammaproteobacteria bacterium]|nr:heme-binding protein [Gammaproteobacteria bacterium]